MRAADAFSDLRRVVVPIVTTDDAAVRWRASLPAASRMLGRLVEAGLVRRLAHGLWLLDPDLDPLAAPPYLTAPHPAYVSFQTALYHRGVIEQIPHTIYVASLGRTRTIRTTLGTYSIHHLPPELIGGFVIEHGGVQLATAAKALVDVLYLANVRSRTFAALPEVELPRGIRREAGRWIAVIRSQHRRTMTQKRLDALVRAA